MASKFKVGQKVRVVNCCEEDLRSYGSTGEIGEVYIIDRVTSSGTDVCFVDGNWHKERWLVLVVDIRRGGE